MKTKAFVLGMMVATSLPLAAMEDGFQGKGSPTPAVRLMSSQELEEAHKRSLPCRRQLVQDGLLFLGSGLLTATSVSCYIPEAPATSMMMIGGWSCLTVGTGLKFFQTLCGERVSLREFKKQGEKE